MKELNVPPVLRHNALAAKSASITDSNFFTSAQQLLVGSQHKLLGQLRFLTQLGHSGPVPTVDPAQRQEGIATAPCKALGTSRHAGSAGQSPIRVQDQASFSAPTSRNFPRKQRSPLCAAAGGARRGPGRGPAERSITVRSMTVVLPSPAAPVQETRPVGSERPLRVSVVDGLLVPLR